MLRKPTRRHSAISIIILSLALFGFPLLGATRAADGSNGYIQISSQIFHVSGAVISVNMWELDVSADYLLNWTGEDTGISFTTGASQTTYTYTFALTTTENTVTFYLREQSTGTAIDQVQATVVDISDFLATGLIISAGVFILIVVIFKKVIS